MWCVWSACKHACWLGGLGRVCMECMRARLLGGLGGVCEEGMRERLLWGLGGGVCVWRACMHTC